MEFDWFRPIGREKRTWKDSVGVFMIFNKYSIFGLLLLLFGGGVQCDLEHLELLNVSGWRLEAQFKKNYEAMVRDLGPKRGGYFTGLLSRMNPFGSNKAKPEPQKDLEELAQIYGALNSADTAALYFLSKECRADCLLDPKTDPILCGTYPGHLIKQTQSRISNVNSQLIKSNGLLTCPPRWGPHAVTVQSLLKDIDPKNLLEYRVNSAIAKVLVGEEETEAPVEADKEEAVEKAYAEQMASADTEVKATENSVDPVQTHAQIADIQSTDPQVQSVEPQQVQSEEQPGSQMQSNTLVQSGSTVQVEPVSQAQPQPQPQPQPQSQSQNAQQQKRSLYPSEQILNNIIGQIDGGTNSGLNLSIRL